MVKKIADKFNRLSRVHQRHRQTTDRQQTDNRRTADSIYSDREREFTFAKNYNLIQGSFGSEFTVICNHMAAGSLRTPKRAVK